MNIKGPGESSLLLLKVIKRLDQLEISYAIIGAFAASFYGVVRASVDVDALISIEKHERKLTELLDLLTEDGFVATVRRGNFEDPIDSVINIQDQFKNRVDLLTGIKGINTEVFNRTIKTSFNGVEIKIIGVEDFIAMKIFAGSPKDIQDALNALKISAQKTDIKLLKQLTLRFGKASFNKLENILKNNQDPTNDP